MSQAIECFPDPRLVPTEPDIACLRMAVKPASWPLPCKCINKNRPEQLTITVVITVQGGTPPITLTLVLVINGRPVTTVQRTLTTERTVRIPFQGVAQHLVEGVNTIEIQVTARDAVGQTATGTGRAEIAVAKPLPLSVQVGVEA
jgi:hypothetical protein